MTNLLHFFPGFVKTSIEPWSRVRGDDGHPHPSPSPFFFISRCQVKLIVLINFTQIIIFPNK